MDIGSRLQSVQQGESAVERTQAALPVAQNSNLSLAGMDHTGVVASDVTHLSSTAGLAVSLVSQTISLPDVRNDKVEEVRQQIAAGSYQVSASAVAQKMIGLMLEKQG